MKKKGLWNADQFPLKDWEPDNKQALKSWNNFSQEINQNRPNQKSFTYLSNVIDYIQPFVNKRGVRKDPFKGNQHEVKITQLDNIPGYAKLVYKDYDRQVGTLVKVYINSRQSVLEDIQSVSKKLYKKAKKL